MAGLISVLNTEEATAYLTTLNLTEELEALVLKNAQFEVLMSGKLMEEVARTPQTDIETTELRKQLDAQYAEIVQTVNAYAIVQPTDEINGFIAQMNALITLTKRSAASVGKGGKEEEPTPETENGEGKTENSGSSENSGDSETPEPSDSSEQ